MGLGEYAAASLEDKRKKWRWKSRKYKEIKNPCLMKLHK